MIPLLTQDDELAGIVHLDKQLLHHFIAMLTVEPALTRPLVSFQANKTRPVYRWYKYKEAFSASLVEFLFHKYGVMSGKVLDPFAGSGTALFAASVAGMDADGIELLPIGRAIIDAKKMLESEFTPEDFERLLFWSTERIWEQSEERLTLPELRITKGAYPEDTKVAIEKYSAACFKENAKVQAVLRFALICILESVSYTRKDGQYLRWDYRSGRRQGDTLFDKGKILGFGQAVCAKIREIIEDMSPLSGNAGLFPVERFNGNIKIHDGSCLDIMPVLPDNSYDAIITSPPYCNRYDYTRTYALELALIGTDEDDITNLRQRMLSCTVENRAKDLLYMNQSWAAPVDVANGHKLLQAILKYLDGQKTLGALNNNGIPRMVRGYFYEMACVIAECSRVLKPGAPLFMVNDNVRYAGASVSVDLILSNIAEAFGFSVESILVLPNGKGNSSQQMGEFGREPLRKCVYVWRKAF
ncbi:MAG: site-specific DNA-methyltransferase [Nitrospirae bacterium]|nr:site-specific DNA-methyltransferase [Nitrospirota bacterium]